MSIFDLFLNFLFPAPCPICRKFFRPMARGEVICRDCYGDIRGITGPCCPCCGRPFASGVALLHSPDHLCGRCRRRPPHFDRAFTAGAYEGVLRAAIHLFKYQKRSALGMRLTRHLSGFLPLLPPADGLLPVPLHPERLRRREFNQSLIICRVLGKVHRLPVLPDLLHRVRPTPPQVELHRKNRAGNVRGAFQIRRGVPSLEGKHLILVDDVLTTGSTVNECARVLKKAGVEKVYVVTLARTLGP